MSDEQVLDGNARQVRMIANELAKAMKEGGGERHNDPEFVEWLDRRIGEKQKLWAAAVIIAYAVPMFGAAFFLGGMNEKLDVALSEQRSNTQSLQARGGWMNDQEKFNCDVRRAIMDTNPGASLGDCAFVNGQDRSDSRR